MGLGLTPSLSWLVVSAPLPRAVVAVVARLLGIVVPRSPLQTVHLLYPCYYSRDILIMLERF
jgi:hypothetical protein